MTTTAVTDPGVELLLGSEDPSIRYLTLVEVAGEAPGSPAAAEARAEISNGERVQTLLQGWEQDPSFGANPYRKWWGTHWRLVALAELQLPEGHRAVPAMAELELDWLNSSAHRSNIPTIEGRVRRCASQEGNALYACASLGLAGDERVAGLAADLVAWQWPDGGWNCDRRPATEHSSFHESWIPMVGLAAYGRAAGDKAALAAALRAAEFFLAHHLFRSHTTGEVAHPHLLRLRWPPYWHYDVLAGLRAVRDAGVLSDPRTCDALDVLESKRGRDGRWKAQGRWWRPMGEKGDPPDVVDWGPSGPNQWVTLQALRVLRAAGRL